MLFVLTIGCIATFDPPADRDDGRAVVQSDNPAEFGFRSGRWDQPCSQQTGLGDPEVKYSKNALIYRAINDKMMIEIPGLGTVPLQRVDYWCIDDKLDEIDIEIANQGQWESFRTYTQEAWFDGCLKLPCGSTEQNAKVLVHYNADGRKLWMINMEIRRSDP